MAFVAAGIAIGGMAGLGAIGGAMKSGNKMNMYGRGEAGKAYDAYKNLVGKGPGEKDVANSYEANTQYANTLNNVASSGLYDQAAGNRLAEQQFGGQRQALAQSMQDQMAVANRAASSAGRSSNDPIVRARLGAESMRQTASLNAQQASASMALGRQSTMDMLSMGSQRVNMLQSMSDQAFNNQNNLFSMGGQLQQLDAGEAQYEMSRGGGLKGALTGAMTGAGAGMQMATGFSGMSNATKVADAGVRAMDRMGNAPSGGGQQMMPAQQPQQAPMQNASQGIPSYLMSNANYAAASPMQTGQWFNINAGASAYNNPGISSNYSSPNAGVFNWQSGGNYSNPAAGNPFSFLAPGSALRR